MKNKKTFVFWMLIALLLAAIAFTQCYVNLEKKTKNTGELQIVTSFYPMYIATANLVKDVDGVTVTNLSEPQTGCLHDYQLTTADMKLLSTADLFIVNGGGIEGFLTEVAEAYPQLKIVSASDSIEALEADDHENHDDHEATEHEEADNHEDHEATEHEEAAVHEDHEDHVHNHGEVNGHLWMSVENHELQVANIAKALKEMDALHATSYESNLRDYLQKLEKLREAQEEIREQSEGAGVVILHSAFAYVAKDYDWQVLECLDLDEEDQVTALSGGDIAQVVELIKANQVSVLLVEKKYGQGIATTLEQETGAKPLYLNTCNRGDGSLDSYIEAMGSNIEIISEVLGEKGAMK